MSNYDCASEDNEEFDARELREGVERIIEQNTRLREKVCYLEAGTPPYRAADGRVRIAIKEALEGSGAHNLFPQDIFKVVSREEGDTARFYGKYIGEFDGMHLYNLPPVGLFLSAKGPYQEGANE